MKNIKVSQIEPVYRVVNRKQNQSHFVKLTEAQTKEKKYISEPIQTIMYNKQGKLVLPKRNGSLLSVLG